MATPPSLFQNAVDSVKELLGEFWKGLVGLKQMGIILLGAAVVIGAILLVGVCSYRRESRNGPGRLENAHLVMREGAGPVLVVGELVVHEGHAKSGTRVTKGSGRLDSLDLTDGHRLARAVFDRGLECVQAAPGLVWCDSGHDHSVELRDAVTLAVRTNPGHIASTTELGRSPHFTADQLAVSGSVTYYFEGKPRSVVIARDTSQRTPDGDVIPRTVAPGSSYIAPHFLAAVEGPALASGADNSAFVAHDDSVDHATAGLLVSALTLDGAVRWTITFPDSELRGAWSVDHHLVLAISGHDGPGAVVAVDPADGRILWRTET